MGNTYDQMLKLNKSEIQESLIVFLVLTGIFLPLRIIFVRYISDEWIGSFGIISLIFIILIILAKKDRLGKFGKMLNRQLFKIHRGKRKYYIYFNMTVALLFFSTAIYAIETSKSSYSIEVNEIMAQVPDQPNFEDPEEIQEYFKETLPDFSPIDFLYGFLFLIVLPFTNYDAFIILWGILDESTNGWFLHISTIIFIEYLEMLGILIFTRITIKNNPTII